MRKRPSFLRPLAREPHRAFRLRNMRTGVPVVASVEPAFDSRTRNRGLLGRTGLPADQALAIAPCNAVHTIAMKFTIDVMFVNRDGSVRRIVHGLRPYRLAASFRSHCVIETAAGVIAASGTRVGDTLGLDPVEPSTPTNPVSP